MFNLTAKNGGGIMYNLISNAQHKAFLIQLMGLMNIQDTLSDGIAREIDMSDIKINIDKFWIHDGYEISKEPRQHHKDIDGERVRIGEEFSLGVHIPRTFQDPAEDINCFCRVEDEFGGEVKGHLQPNTRFENGVASVVYPDVKRRF